MLKNPISRYRLFLMMEVLVVISVIALFRIISDRLVAGAVAGAVFLFSTGFVIATEWKEARRLTFALAGALLFFVGGVLPILILRWMSWGQSFETSELMGISGGFLHRSSNLLFLFFLVGMFISLQRARWKARAQK
jgi:hypothetical protein